MLALAAPKVRIDKAARIGPCAASRAFIGTARELRQVAKGADKITAFMAVLLQKKTGASARRVKKLLRGPMRWWTAEQALADGFVDEIVDFASTVDKMRSLPVAIA
jgi:ATP-dependent protease ClpP protease subunit